MGIDPGLEGGISLIFDGQLVDCRKWSDDDFMDMIKVKPDVIYLEKLQSFHNDSPMTSFSMGRSFGWIHGAAYAKHYVPDENILCVFPQTWKAYFKLTKKGKAGSIALALELFPYQNFLPTPRCRKPSDGMAESALIALYGYRMEMEKQEEDRNLPF